jgi:hypothetical protein
VQPLSRAERFAAKAVSDHEVVANGHDVHRCRAFALRK